VSLLSDEKLAGVLVRAGVKFLTNNDYLTFGAAIFRKVADGEINPALGLPILYAGDKEGVLAVNHDDPRLANVLPKVLHRYADNPQQTTFIQKLISGKAKQEHIDWCSAQGLTPAQVVALVPSDAVTDPSHSPKVQPPAPKKTPSTTPTTTTPIEKPTSSTPWSIFVVLIVAAMGLLWLLLKRRS
jgi:hypothetical protein